MWKGRRRFREGGEFGSDVGADGGPERENLVQDAEGVQGRRFNSLTSAFRPVANAARDNAGEHLLRLLLQLELPADG